jgi:putative Holliday junction resolvase
MPRDRRGTVPKRGRPESEARRCARGRRGPAVQSRRVKVLALDYGSARTGVAVSDPTGTVARPLEVVERAGSRAGLARVAEIAEREDVERIVVGMPVTLRGEHGAQAAETGRFVEALRGTVHVPVETFDERFTTRLAARRPAGGRAPEDAAAAAYLLTGYLSWSTSRRG